MYWKVSPKQSIIIFTLLTTLLFPSIGYAKNIGKGGKILNDVSSSSAKVVSKNASNAAVGAKQFNNQQKSTAAITTQNANVTKSYQNNNKVSGSSFSKGTNSNSTSANSQSALRTKYSGLQNAQKNPSSTRKLPDGRVRYYTKEVKARTDGPTRGASFVTEYNKKTGQSRQWMESYDKSGKVNRVHPKSVNGQTVKSTHYPPTAKESK